MDKEIPSSKPPLSNEKKGGLTFPCDFVIKVFGLTSDEFNKTVLALIQKHAPEVSEKNIQSRPSKDHKYLALSITVHVDSQEQLDAIYRELSTNPAILMAL